MADSEIKSTATGMRNLLLVASICTILIAGLELIGWFFEWQLYAAAILRSIPMAPSTAICFILLTMTVLIEPRKTWSKAHLTVSMSVIILVIVFCGLDLLESLGATSLDIEGYLLPEPGFLYAISLGRMSPMTAVLFVLSAGAMLFIVIRFQGSQEHRLLSHLSGLLGCVVAFSGFTLALGYLYGTPMLYHSGFVPVAVTTALGFLFLGVALLARLESDDIPKRYFLASPVHRQLSLVFVPLVFFTVLLQGILCRFAPLLVDINNALLSALLAGAVTVLAVIATSKAISSVGGALVQAEEALQASEERRRLAQDAAKAGTWEWDLRTNENFWSGELWTLYGLEPDSCEPSYESWVQTIHPDDRAETERAVREAASKGIELNAVWRTHYLNGLKRWLMSRGRPIRDENGRVIRYIGIVIDITERKRTEEALRASEEKYKLLVDKAQEAIFVVQDTIFRFVNPRLEEIVGFPADELIGKPFGAFVHPDDREAVIDRHYRRLNGDVFPSRYEIRIIDNRGKVKWVEIDSVVIGWEGKPAVMVFLTDTTY